MFNCDICGKGWKTTLSLAQHRRCHNGHKKSNMLGVFALNKKVQASKMAEYRSKPQLCLNCQKTLTYYQARKLRKVFCNSSCSCSFNNKQRKLVGFTTKGRVKEILCPVCNDKLTVGLHYPKSIPCKRCGDARKPRLPLKPCKCCNNSFSPKKRTIKCCSSECVAMLRKKGGINGSRISVGRQRVLRRSKNEIYFSELCKEKFNNILVNEAIFNGWDADIILPDLKTAILWNGVWHYKKITKQHSVKQVQNRDRIKVKEIQQCGFTPYIIKDMGKHNKVFVRSEFAKFVEKIAGRSL